MYKITELKCSTEKESLALCALLLLNIHVCIYLLIYF